MEKSIAKASLWEWVKAICTIVLTVVVAIKIYVTPTSWTVDFPTLLSLLLALFSVGLAALFYFKATDTSNTFYDNTYKFTKDLAELLVKMESGFGEKLRNLDEGYSSIRGYIQNLPAVTNGDLEETQAKLKSEREEVEKTLEERNSIIENLVEQSQMKEEEKESVLQELSKKEGEVLKARKEIEQLDRRLMIERARSRGQDHSKKDSAFIDYTFRKVIGVIGAPNIIFGSDRSIREAFDALASNLPNEYLKDLEKHGYFDVGLTPSGLNFLKDIAESSF